MKIVSRDSNLSWKLYAENGAWTELPRSGDLPLSVDDCGVGMEDVYAFLIRWPMA